MRRSDLILFLGLCPVGWAIAQLQTYNHPELAWRSIETDHFFVHFHQGTERTAALTAKIAEEIYEPITSLYRYTPDGKIHLIVRDHDDDSNGAAFYYDNKIEIWAPALDFALRGTHNWLRDVLAHEFSHMISLGAARKMPRQIPAIYFQWLDYEREKRPDVIHGYPKTLVSFPWAGTVLPMWFAEGIAQFQRAGLDYDTWDTHRDMVLRTAVLEEDLLPLTEMAIFGKNSLGNERVYNQGYGLTLYLFHRYGEDALHKLIQVMKKPWRVSFSGAVNEVLKKSERALYEEWSDWLHQGYVSGSDAIRQNRIQGHIVEGRGTANFYPSISPDCRWVAYISSRGQDYMSQLNLWLYDRTSGKSRKLRSGVTSSVSWSPDGKRLVYAKKTARTPQGSHYYDLYIYDLETQKEKRITKSLRARQPDWSRDGRMLVFIVESDGISNLAMIGADGLGFKKITSFQNGEVYSPRWFPDGKKVVFALSETKNGRDIAAVDTSGSDFHYLLRTDSDERDPSFGKDGGFLYYASDRTGIFNLYRMDVNSKSEAQITNVVGGAFMPAVDEKGSLVYSLFQADGYKIARMDSVVSLDPRISSYQSPYQAIREEVSSRHWDIAQFNDLEVPHYSSRSYKPMYSKISFLPRLMVDYPEKLKVGTYFYGSDFLDKISLFGGVAVNGLFDTDAFGIFEYRWLYPTLFLEAYQQMRHTSEEDAKYRFDLMEVDIGADWPISDHHRLRTAYVFSRYAASMTFEEQGQKIKFPYTYHIGNVFQARWEYKVLPPSLESDIAPRKGRIVTLHVESAHPRFLNGFEVNKDYGTLVETYDRYHYQQVFLDWQEYMTVPWVQHSVSFHIKAGVIDRPVHSFYNFFAGGLDGLKGYPYYSIEGRRLLQIGLAYRVPLVRRMGIRFGFLNLDKLYLSLYGDMGNAWDGGGVRISQMKKDVGLQLRLGLVSFYSYPMSLFFDAAYGLDRFTHKDLKYGGEWRTYFGLLFHFLD